eukprot:GEMP01085921.1.p1 GENE.GEMP01085921.1~~GEMP01085921.1.p1  ORF type:complete len:196 (+),score=53.11 GEMP01085921.1:59-589(+)
MMRLLLKIDGSHEELANYQSEINSVFSALGVPDSYSVHIDKRGSDKRERVEDDEARPAKNRRGKGKGQHNPDEENETIGTGEKKQGKGGKKGHNGKGARRGRTSAQPRYSGTIRKWNETRNYYFVQCDELKPHFNCDVVVQKPDVPAGADIGTEITFIAMQAEGTRNPVAQEVRLA